MVKLKNQNDNFPQAPWASRGHEPPPRKTARATLSNTSAITFFSHESKI